MNTSNMKKTSFWLLLALILQCIITISAAVTTCDSGDKAALLAFKAGITNDHIGHLSNWNASTDCCSAWNGISCDIATGRVVNVSLPGVFDANDTIFDSFMVGTISPAIGNLTSLINLDLGGLKQLSEYWPDGQALLYQLA